MLGQRATRCLLLVLLVPGHWSSIPGSSTRYGVYIGQLKLLQTTGIGQVYVVNEKTLFIKNFNYDGNGRDTYFWIGSESESPSPEGVMLPFPDDGGKVKEPLQRFTGADILLRLPANVMTQQVRWLSIWCQRFTMDFGHVVFPAYINPPRSRQLDQLKQLAHKVQSGRVAILDVRTFYIPNLHYDGKGSDAYFWVGNGSEPNPSGIKVPDQTGSYGTLGAYMGQDIEITLPEGVTVYSIQWLAIWSVQYRHNFGWLRVPSDLNNIPPYIRQSREEVPQVWSQFEDLERVEEKTSDNSESENSIDLPNCRSFVGGQLQVHWNSDDRYVYVQLSARLKDDEWMGFGLSGLEFRTEMEGGDVVVVFYDHEDDVFRAEDYYLNSKSQCTEGRGVCPDHVLGGSNDVQIISGERFDGITSVTYKRLMDTGDYPTDRRYERFQQVNVIASIGVLNERKEVNYHSRGWDSGRIDFAAVGFEPCSDHHHDPDDPGNPESATVSAPHVDIVYNWQQWNTRFIVNTQKLHFRLGPSAGIRGYPTELEDVNSHEISLIPPESVWWVNDELMPEIYVHRGRQYMFMIEAGNDPSNPAEYHPLYITDSEIGGYATKNQSQRSREKVFAGVKFNSFGGPMPSAAGRLCRYRPKGAELHENSATFEQFRSSLQLECQRGQPALLTWKVAQHTPDLVFYQCYTHKYMGWKIHVLDSGEIPDINRAVSQSLSIISISIFVWIFTMV